MTKHIPICGFPRNEPEAPKMPEHPETFLSSVVVVGYRAANSRGAVTANPAYRPGIINCVHKFNAHPAVFEDNFLTTEPIFARSALYVLDR